MQKTGKRARPGAKLEVLSPCFCLAITWRRRAWCRSVTLTLSGSTPSRRMHEPGQTSWLATTPEGPCIHAPSTSKPQSRTSCIFQLRGAKKKGKGKMSSPTAAAKMSSLPALRRQHLLAELCVPPSAFHLPPPAISPASRLRSWSWSKSCSSDRQTPGLT